MIESHDTPLFRSFAIIPAAGRSARMGQDKLLLPWEDSTVIETVIAAWRASSVSEVILVTRSDNQELARRCRAAGVIVVIPEVPPAEMKTSVQIGLSEVAKRFSPEDDDVWLLAPGDMPRLTACQIDAVLEQHEMNLPLQGSPKTRIVVPTCGSQRGHPVLFPWPLAAEIGQLDRNEGVNAIVRRHDVQEIAFADAGILHDLDTPADYQRLKD
jgi:molybdenum cofactor cytidylyltransferase